MHAFTECGRSLHFLNSIADIIPSDSFTSLSKEFIFGVEDPAINLIALVIKQYICNVKRYNKMYSLNACLEERYKRIVAEFLSLNIAVFNKTWQCHVQLVANSLEYYDSYSDN